MKKKRKTIITQTENGLMYHLPFLHIIRKKGYYWIHENTVKEYDPFNTGIFITMLESHNMRIKKHNKQLQIFKIVNNVFSKN